MSFVCSARWCPSAEGDYEIFFYNWKCTIWRNTRKIKTTVSWTIELFLSVVTISEVESTLPPPEVQFLMPNDCEYWPWNVEHLESKLQIAKSSLLWCGLRRVVETTLSDEVFWRVRVSQLRFTSKTTPEAIVSRIRHFVFSPTFFMIDLIMQWDARSRMTNSEQICRKFLPIMILLRAATS